MAANIKEREESFRPEYFGYFSRGFWWRKYLWWWWWYHQWQAFADSGWFSPRYTPWYRIWLVFPTVCTGRTRGWHPFNWLELSGQCSNHTRSQCSRLFQPFYDNMVSNITRFTNSNAQRHQETDKENSKDRFQDVTVHGIKAYLSVRIILEPIQKDRFEDLWRSNSKWPLMKPVGLTRVILKSCGL